MKAHTIWTNSSYFVVPFENCSIIYYNTNLLEPFHFAAYNNLCGGIYFAVTKKTYTIQ